jgi:ATP-binding cassette, subfamily B, multidrug efflux pump
MGVGKLNRLLKYVWKYKLQVCIPAVAMVLGMLLDMLNPYLAKVIVDVVIKNKRFKILPMILLILLGIAVSRAILGYFKEYLADDLATRVSKKLKQDLYNHIQSLPYSYFDSMNTGELMSRISEDIDNIWKTVGFGFRLLVENAAYFIIATIILFTLNVKLAIVCTVVVLPIAFIAMRLEKVVGITFGKISDQTAALSTTAQENISGVRLVKAFSREKHEILKFLELNKTNYKLNMEQTNIFAKYFPLIEFLTNVSGVLLICFGGYLVIKANMTLGTLVAFTMYSWMLIWPMRMLGWLMNTMAQNMASTKKIFAIMDVQPSIKNNENPILLNELEGYIKFKNVSFSYNEELVLKNINLEIKPGETIAIMGTTGSGKTSLINLIGRYYDVNEGAVFVDGHDVKTLELDSLRSKMSVISQDTFLFSETIKENVKIGNYEATADEIESACISACADDFILKLQEGYETIIGERGIGLSGGQKQRISIARALVRKANILILDDATSALDMETEYALLKNLNDNSKKVTTFIIAHRISAVKNADQIIYLEGGSIVEKGTHEELLSKKGKYHEIFCQQFKDFEDLEGEAV